MTKQGVVNGLKLISAQTRLNLPLNSLSACLSPTNAFILLSSLHPRLHLYSDCKPKLLLFLFIKKVHCLYYGHLSYT